jgi:hypothetical protein
VMSLRDSPEEDLNLQVCNQASNGPAARGISIGGYPDMKRRDFITLLGGAARVLGGHLRNRSKP